MNILPPERIKSSQAKCQSNLQQSLHRDVKPGNILITEAGTFVLADFGISKAEEGGPETRTVQAFRTPVYAPPEQTDTIKYVRDVFSLAVVVIESMCAAKLKDLPDVHAQLAGLDMPEALRSLLLRCVSVEPADRPANGAVLYQSFRSVLEQVGRGPEERKRLWLGFSRSAEAALGGAGVARSKAVADLADAAYVSYRLDENLGTRDRSRVIAVGREFRFVMAPQKNGEMLVTSARGMEFEELDRQRQRSLSVGHQFQWGTRGSISFNDTSGSQGFLLELLDAFHEELEQTDTELVEARNAELVGGWERLLRAREDVARGDHPPVEFDSARLRSRNLKLRLQTESEQDLLATEWQVRSRTSRYVLCIAEVIAQEGLDVTLLVKGRLPRDIPREGLLQPHLGKSQVAFQRQQDAVRLVKNRESAWPKLIDVLSDPSTAAPPVRTAVGSWQTELDDDKQLAVSAGLGVQDLMVVKGPPGTGKTSFIGELVYQYIKKNPESRVLIVSQTHVAVDNVLERLIRSGASGIVRLGDPNSLRIAEAARPLLFDRQMQKWAEGVRQRAVAHMEARAADNGLDRGHLNAALHLQELIEVVREQRVLRAHLEALPPDLGHTSDLSSRLGFEEEAARLQPRLEDLAERESDLLRLASAQLEGEDLVSAHPDVEELEAAVELLLEAAPNGPELLGLLKLQAEWLQRMASDRALGAVFMETSRVVAGTCLGFIGNPAMRALPVDLCILDEASKATSTEALVPLSRARRSILVGDTRQLPPMDEELSRRSDLLQEHDISVGFVQETLFQRLTESLPAESQFALSEQYRMIKPIGDMISECFYDGELRSPVLSGLKGYSHLGKPILWLDTSKSPSRRENAEEGGGSYANRFEAKIVMDRLEAIDRAVDGGLIKMDGRQVLDVLLIAPYRSQVDELVRNLAGLKLRNLRASVETVDAVQGREADLAIFSVTRSNQAMKLGFLGNAYWRRINVALSRARYGLTVVGDASFSESAHGALRDVLSYMRSHTEDCEVRHADVQ